MTFNPNAHPLTFCLDRIVAAIKKTGLAVRPNTIIHSRDVGVRKTINELNVSNVPPGFAKYQLPVTLSQQSVFFVSSAGPNVSVAEHSHDEGDGLRVIISGSLVFEGSELTAGDWMFIPKGTKYSFDVGPMGVSMFYCYSCCCA